MHTSCKMFLKKGFFINLVKILWKWSSENIFITKNKRLIDYFSVYLGKQKKIWFGIWIKIMGA